MYQCHFSLTTQIIRSCPLQFDIQISPGNQNKRSGQFRKEYLLTHHIYEHQMTRSAFQGSQNRQPIDQIAVDKSQYIKQIGYNSIEDEVRLFRLLLLLFFLFSFLQRLPYWTQSKITSRPVDQWRAVIRLGACCTAGRRRRTQSKMVVKIAECRLLVSSLFDGGEVGHWTAASCAHFCAAFPGNSGCRCALLFTIKCHPPAFGPVPPVPEPANY